MINFQDIEDAVVDGQHKEIPKLIARMLEQGAAPSDIIKNGLLAGMAVVSPLFKSGEMFMPEVMLSAKTMNAGLDLLKPLIVEGDMEIAGKAVLGTVESDLHDIGKNLVKMLLESSGFQVIDLGIDVPAEKFAAAVAEHKPDVLGLAALLTTTMPNMKKTIQLLEEKGLRTSVRVLIGGAPVSADFAQAIGADGYAADGAAAVDFCRQQQ
ncbi:corrinoid protein [Sporomusa termitida]|uniref:Methionine synthase n=1 Tax=Sporomusa termitida TaxID=2377 RepID=A0A517DQV3_9FIRM|nr:corrinoid protein [Sporomusa termitida]QDR79698.1 Methionine synthase [Sporomusa termitida]